MTPYPAHGTTPASRTVRSEDRGEIAAALSGHGLDGDTVTELLDAAGLHGDSQCAAAKVSFDGAVWVADLFGQRRETAA